MITSAQRVNGEIRGAAYLAGLRGKPVCWSGTGRSVAERADARKEARTHFEIGTTYQTRSIGDHNCIISITVASRTKCFITTTEGERFKVNVYEGVETIRPWGSYSKCPTLYAHMRRSLLSH